MFDNIFAAIEKWMRELLTGMVESNMSTMFTDVNEKTREIAAQVGRTPQNWNSSVFSMIQNLSESVVVPIAGIIITLVLCYELISMLTERNNLHDVDTWMFFKWVFKAFIAVYLVTKVSDGLIEGLKFSKAAYIITAKPKEIADMIMKDLDRGVTGISARGMYSGQDKLMLFCVVNKKEIVMLKEKVDEIDPEAFVIVTDAREVHGEGFIEKK